MNIKEETETERKRCRNNDIKIEIHKTTKAYFQQETWLTGTDVYLATKLKTRLKFRKYKLFK